MESQESKESQKANSDDGSTSINTNVDRNAPKKRKKGRRKSSRRRSSSSKRMKKDKKRKWKKANKRNDSMAALDDETFWNAMGLGDDLPINDNGNDETDETDEPPKKKRRKNKNTYKNQDKEKDKDKDKGSNKNKEKEREKGKNTNNGKLSDLEIISRLKQSHNDLMFGFNVLNQGNVGRDKKHMSESDHHNEKQNSVGNVKKNKHIKNSIFNMTNKF